jgi:hypothetical protein
VRDIDMELFGDPIVDVADLRARPRMHIRLLQERLEGSGAQQCAEHAPRRLADGR